jgi:putative oxidoreductase
MVGHMTIRRLEPRLDAYSPIALTVYRAVIGFLFAIHGSSILFAWPVDMGVPTAIGAWPAWWAGLIELVTGLLVMLGLFTRPAAFIAAGQMAIAYFWQHQPHGLLPIQNKGELAVLYCFAFLLLIFFGGGAYALDARLRRAAATAGVISRGSG